MLDELAWLGLEAKYLDAARSFYEETLSLSVATATETEIRFEAGPSELVIRRPIGLPRGGLHTHFACSIPSAEYDAWWDRLEPAYELAEVQFGDAKSLYCYDPDGNCVELGQRDVDGPGIDGIFEVALEVASIDRSRSFYERFGFETVDTGADRRRIRMDGPVALELWEPQLGIADARGGVHVDLGFSCDDPRAVVGLVEEDACETTARGSDRVVIDPDGHVLTFTESAS
ncbi:glyoxalase/bleomycin resistance protein/dioxygenase [Halovivax asiaticus JCM 14624]|uniref:Glyoxalase/bleomycin resistance protein/dioxygenase n=1 Tax=Halovivax asiaticus JCM 14624 TaxID=1227490 RepID=M0BS62_9EURY|nr:VOC family protein [Halovivax asiaticus]ELZ13785.1 glyoxalase/bleomycin resistance protein/dioxygenase [Halovivax asiaticus JCM 14624]